MAYIKEYPPPPPTSLGSKRTASRSLYSRQPAFLGGRSAGTFITRETKEPNNRVLLGVSLFGCIVSFVVRNDCASVPTEGTFSQAPPF